jgi:hypothetical protein
MCLWWGGPCLHLAFRWLTRVGGRILTTLTMVVDDAFIAKFSGSNLSLVWSTYFGGSSGDLATSVAVDGSGDVFVVGWTYSSNFPLGIRVGGRIITTLTMVDRRIYSQVFGEQSEFGVEHVFRGEWSG